MTKFNTNSVKKGQHAIMLFQTTQFFYSAESNFSIHSANSTTTKNIRNSTRYSIKWSLGCKKTIERIRQRFYWPNWEAQTKEFVLSCQICQQTKHLRHNNAAQLRPILTNRPLQIETMDIAGP